MPDPIKFIEGRLDGIFRNELREVLGSVSSNDILSSDRALLMDRILSGAKIKGRAIGIEVIDVRAESSNFFSIGKYFSIYQDNSPK